MKHTIILTIIWALSSTLSHGQTSPLQMPELLRTYLEIEQDRLGFQGVCLVNRGGRVLFHQAFGLASQELGVKMEVDHRFQIASISKSFTALLIGLAIDEGKMNLQDRLTTFLPELSGDEWDEISIQQLLTHTSGVPHHNGMVDYWPVRSRLTLTTRSILEAIRKMKLKFTPGEDYLYSSPAYFLLATVLEKVYQLPLSRLWSQKIGQALGLEHTGFDNNQTVIPRLVSGYHLLPDERLISAPYRDFSGLKGGGDMYSNAADLNQWNQYILQELQNPGFLAEAVRPKNNYVAKGHHGAQYGWGWFIRREEKNRPVAYFHGGGTYGCSAMSAIYPEERLSIIILSNVSGLPMDMIWQNVEAIALGRSFELPKSPTSTGSPNLSLDSYIGNFVSTPDGQRLRIFVQEEQLFAQLQGRPPFLLSPLEEHRFYGNKVGISFSFEVAAKHQVVGLKAEGRGRNFSFEKED
ncbi:MAG: beta-lactamase family protein [Saprospiraceae bacterium]|nr:beta-lactamase family protein [Saprospiraceae bacterium]